MLQQSYAFSLKCNETHDKMINNKKKYYQARHICTKHFLFVTENVVRVKNNITPKYNIRAIDYLCRFKN